MLLEECSENVRFPAKKVQKFLRSSQKQEQNFLPDIDCYQVPQKRKDQGTIGRLMGRMEDIMGESKVTNQSQPEFNCFKEAVCINAQRIYDSCSDKDCLEDLQVYFSDQTQPIINRAANVKCKKVKILCVNVEVESVPFNKGFYSVDMTFYFLVEVAATVAPGSAPVTVCGISYFNKKVILYGSEAGSKEFSSRNCVNGCCGGEDAAALPEAVVQTVDPVCLASKFVECPQKTCCPSFCIPCCQCCELCGDFEEVEASKEFYVTLGLFTIVQIQRPVAMMIPAYDFCIPDKESEFTNGDPCEMFKKIQFPMGDFFPARMNDLNCDD